MCKLQQIIGIVSWKDDLVVKALRGELQMKPLSGTAVQINNTEKGFVKFSGCPKLCRKGKHQTCIWLAHELPVNF